jgi:L-threonylcarbamoyladenylate synthase
VPDRDDLADAVAALGRGDLVVVPTDTVYGLAARPDLPGATDRVFQAKQRPRDLTLPVLAADGTQAEQVARFGDAARTLADRFWPGALTLVLPRTEAASAWALGRDRDTVAVRVPADELTRSLLRMTGPLATTSANLSGQPTPAECDDVRAVFGDAVAVYLCRGRLSGAASTIVSLAGPEPVVVREGALSSGEVLGTLR